MITGEHTVIRFSEPDDAAFLGDLYLKGGARAALLDARREPILPTRSELHEMLIKKDAARGLLYTVEDREGLLCGWCALRSINYEARYAELALLFADDSRYAGGAADEALAFLLEVAFGQFDLFKVLVMCLDREAALAACLTRHGFMPCGRQRQVLFSGGLWHDLDTYALFANQRGCTIGMDEMGKVRS